MKSPMLGLYLALFFPPCRMGYSSAYISPSMDRFVFAVTQWRYSRGLKPFGVICCLCTEYCVLQICNIWFRFAMQLILGTLMRKCSEINVVLHSLSTFYLDGILILFYCSKISTYIFLKLSTLQLFPYLFSLSWIQRPKGVKWMIISLHINHSFI